MGKIHVLDKALAELIAAGEVVERPASIAKELIENSIDAGAKSVAVEIENGGIAMLRVTDDGCGISREDIPTAFLRHATSKVHSPEDLDGIVTLGFRGEALASIAAMSRVEITSKTAGEEEGSTYRVEGGEEVSLTAAGCPTGTIITVRDVFYNTPARMKFLKKDVGEGNAVAQVVEKCALSHPEIAFRFVRDGKLRFSTSGGGELLPVIAVIYGKEFATSMMAVHHEMKAEGISVSGYVTSPSGAKASRAYQNFFLNARYVKTRTAMASLEEAFKGVIGGGKYPGCVLHIDIVPALADVNVHPAKIEVRFANERPVFQCVYHAVKGALAATRNGTAITAPPETRTHSDRAASAPARMTAADFQAVFAPGGREEPLFTKPLALKASAPDIYVGVNEGNPADPRTCPPTSVEVPPEQSGIIAWDNAGESPKKGTVITNQEYTSTDESCQQRLELVEDRLIGEFSGTYILLERNGNLIMVDKHAAHERLLYEQLKEQIAYGNRQVLLSPITITLAREEAEALLENSERLLLMGFLAEDFGSNTIAVREIPLELAEGDVAYILGDIAAKLVAGKMDLTPRALDRLHFSIACKSAVRAKDKNTLPELAYILRRLHENPEITHCPHGRPVQVVLSAYEVEKLFGRQG